MSAIDLRRAAFATLLSCYHNSFANEASTHRHSPGFIQKVLAEAGADKAAAAFGTDPRLTSTDAGAIAVGIAKRVATNEKASKSFIDVEISESAFIVTFDKDIKPEMAMTLVGPMGKTAQLCKSGDKIGEGLVSDILIIAVEPQTQVAEGFVQDAKAAGLTEREAAEIQSPEHHAARVAHLHDLIKQAPGEDRIKLKQYLGLEQDRLSRAKALARKAPATIDIVRQKFGGITLPESVTEADAQAADALHGKVKDLWAKHTEGDKHPGNDWDKWDSFFADAHKELGHEHANGLAHIADKSHVGDGPERPGEFTLDLLRQHNRVALPTVKEGEGPHPVFKEGERVLTPHGEKATVHVDRGAHVPYVQIKRDGSAKHLSFSKDAIKRCAEEIDPAVTEAAKALFTAVHGEAGWTALAESTRTQAALAHMMRAFALPTVEAGVAKTKTGNDKFDAIFRACVDGSAGGKLTEAMVDDLAFAIHENFPDLLAVHAVLLEGEDPKLAEAAVADDAAKAGLLKRIAGHLLLSEGVVLPAAQKALEVVRTHLSSSKG